MKKLTVNQKEFEKQVKRLTRYVRAYENKGLVFITPIIPERPKRVTKQRIEALRQIKPTDIARKAYEVDKTTGLVTPYLEPDVRKARRTARITHRERRTRHIRFYKFVFCRFVQKCRLQA